MNIVDPILFQCKLNPETAAICAPGTALHAIKYGLLARCIGAIGRVAQSANLQTGQVVAILVNDNIFHAALILGLTRMGIVTVSARSPKLPKGLAVSATITDASGAFENAGRIIEADPKWLVSGDKFDFNLPESRGDGDDICRIVLTSGTTGEAKAIALSHNNLLGRVARHYYARGNRFPLASRLYCDLGVSTSPGFQYLIYMLTRGGTIFYFGEDPQSTAQAFDLYKVQNMIASPSGLAEWVQLLEATSAFQIGFDHILCSGGILPLALSRRVRARMCTNLFGTFGSSEVGPVCVGPAHLIAEVPGGVGYLTPEAEVEIIDTSGNVLPANEEGIVRVRTPQTVDHYLGDPEMTRKVFRGGWFYPGDIGCLTPDRMLVIRGRQDAILSIGGDKVNPELVEEVLVSEPGIAQAAVFARTNEIGIPEMWAALVLRAPVDEAKLRTLCRQKLGHAFAPVRFVTVGSLPRNRMGKIERHKVAEWVELN